MRVDRRSLVSTLAAAGGALLTGCAAAPRAPRAAPEDDEVTPAEDLMREHGVLRRVMYLYDEAALRLDAGREVPLDAVAGGAELVRRAIQSYHERLEEDFLFPRFEAAGRLAELVATLRRQHQSGRAVTARITALARAPLAAAADRAQLAALLRAFTRMYRPHADREDTVLFPALRGLVGPAAYAELGERFEEREREMLGERGFERAVEEVARLEAAFGLDDLGRLTAG